MGHSLSMLYFASHTEEQHTKCIFFSPPLLLIPFLFQKQWFMLLYNLFQNLHWLYSQTCQSNYWSRREIEFDTRTSPSWRCWFIYLFIFKLGAVFNHYQYSVGKRVLFWFQLQSQLGKWTLNLKLKALQKVEGQSNVLSAVMVKKRR